MFATVTEADYFPKHFRLVCFVLVLGGFFGGDFFVWLVFLTRIIWCVLI